MPKGRTVVYTPDAKSREEARTTLRFLTKEPGRPYEVAKLSIENREDGKRSVEVPSDLAPLFMRILSEVAQGNGISVSPVDAELTTQQAAEYLNVSRPYLVSLLEAGKIPFRKVGTKRRVKLAALARYNAIEQERQRKALDELAAEAQKLGLGY